MRIRSLLLFVFSVAITVTFLPAQTAWTSIGPDGGDARNFAVDPTASTHLYLGTTSSWIYQSGDGGSSWSRLAKLGNVDDLVLDNLLVDSSDPKTLFAGVWVMDHNGGGIYISHDKGKSWTGLPGMEGQSVRALAQAPSNPKILVAGTLSGIYRSEDKGLHWTEISPTGSGEIREVESIAIDPADPQTIYAGTWHLPWKTTDGGAHWNNIKEGLIDDSDVFSIIIDPSRPSVVYASACSGIYRSDNGGDLFRKVQGIPSTARRTRVLMQDPADRNTVYAGTTEGLYKTTDGGDHWVRMTGPDVIVNDIYIDPKNPRHVLLATDRSGVLASEDAAAAFQPSNTGFSQRQVATLLADTKEANTMYAGVVNDKTYGGVFATHDGGRVWKQESEGLEGRDVFTLAQSANGMLVAGTNRGVFRREGEVWRSDGTVINHSQRTTYTVQHGKRIRHTIEVKGKTSTIEGRVSHISIDAGNWYAATTEGVYRSRNQGESWEGPVLTAKDYLFVGSSGPVVFAARRQDMMVSGDDGEHWQPSGRPDGLSSVNAVAVTPDGTLWVGGREGVFLSSDRGQAWQRFVKLPLFAINGLTWDPSLKRIIVTSDLSTLAYAVNPEDKTWEWWNTGWKVHTVHSLGDRLVAASIYDGVVEQPAGRGGAAMATEARR